jgi:hypothetical protein
MRGAKWLGKRLALAGVSFLLGLLIAEAALRILGVGYPLPYAPDVYCGTRHQPGFRGQWTAEGRARIEINADGFRDLPRAKAPDPGTLRVAVLGDSYIEAFQVPREQSFAAALERELDAQTDRQVEVLSFGVSGFGTAQQLLLLRHYVWEYQPDVVLLAFCPGNDLADNSAKLAPYQVKPFFHLKHGRLVLDNSFRRHPDFVKAQSPWTRIKVNVINRSRVLQLVAQARTRQHRTVRQTRASEGAQVGEMCFVPPERPEWVEAWEITERLLAQMHAEIKVRGARFVLATLSAPEQVHPDPAVRRALEERLGAEDLFYHERRLEDLGRREGFPVINLGRPMQQYADMRGVFLHGFPNTRLGEGHWNAAGHRVAAELAVRELVGHLPE